MVGRGEEGGCAEVERELRQFVGQRLHCNLSKQESKVDGANNSLIGDTLALLFLNAVWIIAREAGRDWGRLGWNTVV